MGKQVAPAIAPHRGGSAIIDLHHRERGQVHEPVHNVHIAITRQLLELLVGGVAAVHVPGQLVALVTTLERLVEHLLMVAHEHAHIRERADYVDHAQRVGAAIDHIAEHEDGVVRTGLCKLEGAAEGARMPVDVRDDEDGHLYPLKVNLNVRVIVPRFALEAALIQSKAHHVNK